MKIQINKCKECPMHYSESEYQSYTCQAVHRNIYSENDRKSFPEWCPLLKGAAISISINNRKEVIKRVKNVGDEFVKEVLTASSRRRKGFWG